MLFKLLASAAVLAVVEAGSVTVFSNDARINYVGSGWTERTDFRDQAGRCTSGSPTYYFSEGIGEYFSFTFVGTQLQVTSLGDSDRGLVSFQLDGGTPVNYNSREYPRKCETIYNSGTLENKSHTFVMKLVGKSPTNLNNDGTVICFESLVYVEQDQADPPVGNTAQTTPTQQTTSSPPNTQSTPAETSGSASEASVTKDAVGASGSGSQSSAPNTPSQTVSAPSSSTAGPGNTPSGLPQSGTDAAQVTGGDAQVPTVPIVLSVLGGVIIIALIAFFFWWRRRRSRGDVSVPTGPPMRRVPPALTLPSASSRSGDRRPLTAQSAHSALSQDLTSSPSSTLAPELQPLSVTQSSPSDPTSLHSLPPLQPVRRLPPIPQSNPIATDPFQTPSSSPLQNGGYIMPAVPPSRGPSSQATTATGSISENQIIALARQIALQMRQDPELAQPAASNLNRSNTFATYMRDPPPCYEEP